jgi:uncharacterized membrane protein HdeD (DUF308 family)
MNRLSVSREQAFEASAAWWLFLLVGLSSVAAGVILVLKPSHSLNALAVVVGIFLLIDGIIELITSFGKAENRGLGAIIGVLGIVVGIALIRHPIHGVTAIGLLIGIWLVAAGSIRFFKAVVEGVRPFLRSVIAWLEICAGVVILSDPHIGYTALAVIAGIWLIVNGFGVSTLGLALRMAEPEVGPREPSRP